MSELIAVRIQVGVNKPKRLSTTVPWNTSVEDFRLLLRQEQNIDHSFGLVLIYNGGKLNDPDISLYDLGICNDSLIICIISKETGREIEALFGKKDEDVKSQDLRIACEIEFYTRPFGFAVWANEEGKNAIVTKVSRRSTIHRGVKIGYCVYKVNDTVVFNWEHKEVLNCLKKMSCPVGIQFIDRGWEESITFKTKPLGFTVVQDKEETNAKVSKTDERAARKGVKVGSHIVSVNGEKVFGRMHKDICEIINNAKFPIQLTFRRPPKLQILSIKKRIIGKNKGNLTKSKRKKFAWALR